MDKTKPASLWVEAALATDLEVVSLVNTIYGYSKEKFLGKPSFIALDNSPRMSFSKNSGVLMNFSVGSVESSLAVVEFNESRILCRKLEILFAVFFFFFFFILF